MNNLIKSSRRLLPFLIAGLLGASISCAPPAPPVSAPAPVEEFADVNGVRLHYVSQGSGPLILFLHGFPEFWYAWRHQLAEFGKDHRAVAVDMRGYNLSSKPGDVAAYSVPTVVEDIRQLADHLGARKLVLVGHDWGGAIAWAFALTHPDRLEKLVIINAPHPGVFGRELASNPEQQRASQYMTTFRTAQAEQLLSANNYGRLAAIFTDLRQAGHWSSADSVEYIKAWSQPGALTGGLNYYRAMRWQEPPSTDANAARVAAAAMVVRVPTLVIWGERDVFLLTGNLDGLEAFVPQLVVRRIPEASHWVVHERPREVNEMIRGFIR